MLSTLVSCAATAVLLGSSLVQAIDLNIDDPGMCSRDGRVGGWGSGLLMGIYSLDQECRRYDCI